MTVTVLRHFLTLLKNLFLQRGVHIWKVTVIQKETSTKMFTPF